MIEIMKKAVATGIGMVGPERIDEINILQATYEAMRMAIGNLKVCPDLLLNDAVTIPGVDIRQVPTGIFSGVAQEQVYERADGAVFSVVHSLSSHYEKNVRWN